ncbi:hypothetical protein ACFYZE_27755 [Streptomyces sp. NPDC001796]|uniref:hypothetical protein n=1 Tax=Streptomyces sp. NPDC001796 TaxID=3364609 RepID=UPI0036C695BE
MTGHAMAGHVWSMAVTGLSVSALVPAVIRATRRHPLWWRLSLPAGAALPFFLVLHAAATLAHTGAARPPGPMTWWEAAVVVAALWFWLPVVGIRHRLTDPGRCLYLYLSMPLLDLPAVGLIAAGENAAGLTMVVSMLPVGFAALTVTWRWIHAEEARELRRTG